MNRQSLTRPEYSISRMRSGVNRAILRATERFVGFELRKSRYAPNWPHTRIRWQRADVMVFCASTRIRPDKRASIRPTSPARSCRCQGMANVDASFFRRQCLPKLQPPVRALSHRSAGARERNKGLRATAKPHGYPVPQFGRVPKRKFDRRASLSRAGVR